MKRLVRLLFRGIFLFIFLLEKSFASVPTPDHVVIVVLENHGYSQIFGSTAAPYLNSLVSDPYGALFKNSFALSHPSQPNYLQFFSGSNQGVIDDNVPAVLPFTTANLGAELLNASKTFTGYSEDLPTVGFTGATSGSYARKHNPWVNWQGVSTNGIPSTANQPLTSFPTDYSLLPTVSFVIPNQDNDMHNGTDPTTITTGDTWMQTHLGGYITWAKTHNSLLIITFDENDNSAGNQVFTLFIGSMVQHGNYGLTITHYNVLRTLEDMYGLTHAGTAATSTTIDYCWNMCYQPAPTITPVGPVSICSGNSITLTASSGVSYLWSNGATTQSVMVTDSGNYYVSIKAANGCSAITQPVAVFGASPNGIVFTETMGTVTGTTAIATHETNNGFDNDGYTMSGSGDLRITSASTGYTGASGSANVFLTNTVGKNFIISGINTTGLANLQLSFGIQKNTSTGTGSDLLIQVSSDGTNYTTLSYPAIPSGAGTAIWYLRTATGTIPTAGNLRIQFIQNATATQYRIDDVKLQYASVPTITASGPTTFCSGDSLTLTASAGSNYLWNTGATTQGIKVFSAGSYTVTVNCVTSAPIPVTLNFCAVRLNIKIFFQGIYIRRDSMKAVVDSVAYPKLCDTIAVEIHDTTSSHALLYTVRDTISTKGIGNFDFPLSTLGHSYYIAIVHRNSLKTWSKYAVLFSSTYVSADFTSPDTSAVNNPVPVLSAVSPSSAIAGSSGFTMTLTGSNFITGSVVQWNGTSLTTTFVSSTQLTSVIPTGNLTTAGTANITVFNSTPGGGASSSQIFTINNPVPVLSAISPSSATAGTSGFTMTITGSNFMSGSIVKWNSNSLTTSYVNSSQLTAVVLAANVITTGIASVTVFNPTPGGGISGTQTFTINPTVPLVKKFLFDATKAETSGNADWVIDEDVSPQRIPTPLQSTITSTTAETYWTGALSSWGIALVKNGNTVETLPSGTAISYGNSSNPQDLLNYDVFVVDEPNIVFTASEKTAILNFVNNGGGLFMVSDHTVSDRNNDGWDSPDIWNDLMTNNTVQNNPFGFSIDLTNISDISSNVGTGSGTTPILNGTQGSVSQLQFNNGATITINTGANANVQGLIWRSTSSTQGTTNIMCASSLFGTGRVFVVSDSSPMDDGTGGAGNTLFPGWTSYSHAHLFMNASLWLAKLQ